MSGAVGPAMVSDVRRVLTTRASLLRRRAEDLTVRVKDQWGAEVKVVPAEAVVMLRTAAFFEECADDVDGTAGRGQHSQPGPG